MLKKLLSILCLACSLFLSSNSYCMQSHGIEFKYLKQAYTIDMSHNIIPGEKLAETLPHVIRYYAWAKFKEEQSVKALIHDLRRMSLQKGLPPKKSSLSHKLEQLIESIYELIDAEIEADHKILNEETIQALKNRWIMYKGNALYKPDNAKCQYKQHCLESLVILYEILHKNGLIENQNTAAAICKTILQLFTEITENKKY